MNTALWIAQGILAIAFLVAGMLKLVKSKAELEPKLSYVEDFSARTIQAIGLVEVLGAVGIVLPWVLGIAPFLTGWAAVGFAATMVGAIVVHLRRNEWSSLPVNAVLLGLSLFVVWGRL